MKILVTLILAIVISCAGVFFGEGTLKYVSQFALGISGVIATIVLVSGAAD